MLSRETLPPAIRPHGTAGRDTRGDATTSLETIGDPPALAAGSGPIDGATDDQLPRTRPASLR